MTKDPRTIATVPVDEIRRIVAENQSKIDAKLGRLPERQCPVCDDTFRPTRTDRIFCGDRCRLIWYKLRRQLANESK